MAQGQRDRPFGLGAGKRADRVHATGGAAGLHRRQEDDALTDHDYEVLALWYVDPIAWWEDNLGGPLPHGPEWEGARLYQHEIAYSVSENRTTNVVTGHSVGKDFTVARLALWWLCTRPNGIVLTTATKEKQVEVVLWGEIRDAYNNAKVTIGGKMAPTAASLRFGPKHYALGMVAADANGLQGFHAKGGVLAIIDEAAGVPDWAIAAFEGCATSTECRVIKIGNGTCSHDHRFAKDCRMKDKPGVRKTIRISSYDSPNVTAGREVVKGLATLEWIEDQSEKHGPESVMFGMRVLGRFPPSSATGYIGYDCIEAARLRAAEYVRKPTLKPDDDPTWTPPVRRLGCDVARYGEDDTECFIVEDDAFAFQPHGGVGISGTDNVTVAKKLVELAVEWHCVSIAVDGGGLGGGVVDSLQDLQERGECPPEIEIYSNDFGAKATRPREHCDRRTELWDALKVWLRERAAYEAPEMIEGEILAPSYKFVGTAIRLEPKDALKKRLGRSPDKADALALAVHGHEGRTSASPRLSIW